MSKFIITEPAPSSTSYIRSGRGGAGNTFHISALPSTTATPKHTSSSSSSASSTRRFFSGIGGAGNVHAANERPPVCLDDEFRSRAAASRDKSSGHCGIGGAGNVYVRKSSNAGSEGSFEDDAASSRSSMSSKAKLWARVSETFARD